MQAVAGSSWEGREAPGAGLRHVTIFFSDIAGFSELAGHVGDPEASRLARRLLTLQEIVITRDGLGQVLQFGGDSVFAVFDNASVALNRSLEIQRLIDTCAPQLGGNLQPHLRIGLHMGEVLVKQGERIEIISRHVNRARRVMEAAAPGQILASDAVVDAARDFIDVPREHQAIRSYGECYLKGVGATGICEVTDRRFLQTGSPNLPGGNGAESGVVSRLELAGYRSVARVGEGAFGVVYRAEQESTGKSVAVKVLNPALWESPASRQRFLDELGRWQQAAVPGFARLLDQRLDHHPPFLVSELIEGRPADVALTGAPTGRIAGVFRDLCATVEKAHVAGIIHGDIKPGNVLVGEDGPVVVTDFGQAILRETVSSSRLSSPGFSEPPTFLAPEILGGAPCGPQSDVYSLGAVLFRVLAGRDPFVGGTIHDIIQAQLYEDPPAPVVFNPGVPDGLQRICLKALEKSPVERYATAGEMAEDLERFLRGEVIHTRPTTYDNLLFHRVQKHVEQIKDWRARGLLTTEESHRLLSSYEGLQRRGLPAVMEGSKYRLWQTLVYLGGWAVINGALLWLIQHWDTLSRAGKLLLGSVPALTTFGLAAAMWRLERFRLVFVALIVGIVATPLLTGVWLHEFKVASKVPESRLRLEVFHTSPGSTQVTNRQILLISLVTMLVAGGIMGFTRTTTHSAQALAAFALFYTACLLDFGLRPHVEHEEWARLALKFVPLLLMACALAFVLLRQGERYYQATPWIFFAAVLFLVILDTLALHGLEEWTGLAPAERKPLSFLLLSVAGAAQAVIGLAARGWLRHRCRSATFPVILAGLLAVLVGLALAGWQDTWPAGWAKVGLFGKQVPVPHLALPVAALVITLLACRYQMLAFLMVGMVGFAFSIHLLGHLYFQDAPTWAKVLMGSGALAAFFALYRELRRTRGNTIDDLIGQSRL